MGAPKVLGQDGDVRTEADLRQKVAFLESENARLTGLLSNAVMTDGVDKLTGDEKALVVRMVDLLNANRRV